MGELIAFTGSNNQMTTYEELYREYLDDRTLVINGDIDETIIEDFILYILKWNKEDLNIPADSRRPIKIYISSPGGNVFNANIFVDVIETSVTPVIGIALDLVASAAFHIYLACHKRYAFKNSTFLQHDGEIFLDNSRKKVKDTMRFFDEGEERLKEHILSHTTMDEKFYDSIYADEFWFYSQQGKELGVVHKIIGEDCDINEIF